MKLRAVVVILLALPTALSAAEQRFPPPDFESGYQLPRTPPAPAPRAAWLEYLDVALLAAALAGASYLAIKSRSRRGLFVLMLGCLAYFGFYRKGCICSIGAIQNVALALFGSGYTIPLTVAAFFLLPLAFTLLFGRTFCAAVCPLGAIQDVVVLHPLRVPRPVEHALGLLPYLYLAAAVTLAATGSAFIICRYDPFISIFRLSGAAEMVLLGVGVLAVGVFIARPYCRYACPYGAILRWLSALSLKHVTITPDECIRCRLCEDACPFGAIDPPTEPLRPAERTAGKARLALLLPALPVLVVLGGWLGGLSGPWLAGLHPVVKTARRVRLEETGAVKGTNDLSDAFRATGRPSRELYSDALAIQRRFTDRWTLLPLGNPPGPAALSIGWAHLMGGFLGAVVGLKLLSLSVRRTRRDYLPNRAKCLSCARCFAYCPRERLRWKKPQSPAGAEP